MNLTLSSIHQGNSLDKNRFIVLICDIDDIKGHAKDQGIKLSKSQIKRVYEFCQNKMSDLLMNDFWLAIEAGIDEIKSEDCEIVEN